MLTAPDLLLLLDCGGDGVTHDDGGVFEMPSMTPAWKPPPDTAGGGGGDGGGGKGGGGDGGGADGGGADGGGGMKVHLPTELLYM